VYRRTAAAESDKFREYHEYMRALLDPRLNLAVLMQLAGLFYWQHYILVGLLLIVAGGALYRSELRSRKALLHQIRRR
jgi:hypothetical protein